ncbi:hypothetical protein LAZ67_20000142 [Cordylochernes scorpioides]|uniref:Sulfotransferase domain-containing protein n=1 Tax=Cordylochernes scorpioides TaxID=51811 RepID=A0ABY6LN54_9ARAC|nr:hypothetical protein LAZ67_20000142 [Cordylochernes scorpioides]
MMFQMPKFPKYQDVDGYRVIAAFSPEAVRSAMAYQPREDDIIVATFPKCGTTWTQNIVFLILNKGKAFDNIDDFLVKTPFLELCGADAVENMPRPGAIKIHFPFNKAPFSSSAKYIYVARNPKDTCVSFYHHTLNISPYEFDGSFDDFFEIFFNSQNDYGDYFDHVLSWYEHRNDPNVLFLTYEELKFNAKDSVLKIAKFLGEEYEKMLIENPDIMDNVLKHSSVEEMRKTVEIDPSEPPPPPELLPSGLRHMNQYIEDRELAPLTSLDLVRKGIVGDWKNNFNEEQAKRLDDKTREKFAGTDILKFWQKLGILE